MKKDHERLEKNLAETQAEKRKLQEPLQKVIQTWGDNSNSTCYKVLVIVIVKITCYKVLVIVIE